MSDPRTLVVMRHAKAEQSGPSDFERQLADSGILDAAEAGQWLAGHGFHPDRALVSAAHRTEQTWAAMAQGAGWQLDATLDDGLYEAGPESALDLIRDTADEVRTLLVVAHNPTVASVAQLLDDGAGDEEAENALAMGFPTCALAVFTYDCDWAELADGSARLVAHHVGRG